MCGTRLDELATAYAVAKGEQPRETSLNTRTKMRRLELALRWGDIRLAHWIEHHLDLDQALRRLTGEEWYDEQMEKMKKMKKDDLAQALRAYQEALYYFKLKFIHDRPNPWSGDFFDAEELESRVRVLDLALVKERNESPLNGEKHVVVERKSEEDPGGGRTSNEDPRGGRTSEEDPRGGRQNTLDGVKYRLIMEKVLGFESFWIYRIDDLVDSTTKRGVRYANLKEKYHRILEMLVWFGIKHGQDP